MCSIAGAKQSEVVEKMLKVMKHRSPDGTKVITDGHYSIGMGRLAIIDLESPDLFPFQSDRLTLTFNGEIYNYRELREELETKGVKFKTNSDTEVLLESYRYWGLGCLDKFNGMFAFAIYDGRLIILARDIAGEKPLYYSTKPFRFASEAKALDFKCQEFPPAYVGAWDTKTDEWLIFHQWWKPKIIDIKNPEEELSFLIGDSVRLRTRSDVPYCLYLSSGIDSTLIATYHNFARTLTYRPAINEHKQREFEEEFKNIVWHLDYPVKSFSAFALWTLAKRACQQNFRVVLSGEGADELFGGYIRYLPDALNEEACRRFPSYRAMFPYKQGLNEWCFEEFVGNLRELLRMGDRMASAFGIENRCPFLDRRIIEFAFSLEPWQKLDGFDTKVLLRKILRKRKPSYEFEEKHGLVAPINEWLGVSDPFDKTKYLEKQQNLWNSFQS